MVKKRMERPRRKATKVQIVLLVNPDDARRVDMLRICMGVSRAEVIRTASFGAAQSSMTALEMLYAQDMGRVIALAQAWDVSTEQFVDIYAQAYSTLTYPPKVADLIAGQDAVMMEKVTGRKTRTRALAGV